MIIPDTDDRSLFDKCLVARFIFLFFVGTLDVVVPFPISVNDISAPDLEIRLGDHEIFPQGLGLILIIAGTKSNPFKIGCL